jgi:hypothetical protein
MAAALREALDRTGAQLSVDRILGAEAGFRAATR